MNPEQTKPMLIVNIYENGVKDSMKRRGIQDLEMHRELVVEKLKENAGRYVDASVDDAGNYMEERN